MFLLNQKDIYIGYDLSEFNRIREILDGEGIQYRYKTISHSRQSRGMIGSMFVNHNYENQYVLSVMKGDYEKAQYLIVKR